MSTQEMPAPIQQPTTVPSEMIRTFTIPKQPGEYIVELPADADVFAVASEAEFADAAPMLRLWATVTVYDHATTVNPPRPRTIIVAATGQILPSSKFPREVYTKTYVGTVAGNAWAFHVWQIRRK